MRLVSILTVGVLAVLLPRSGFGQTVTDSFDNTSRIDTANSSGYTLAVGTLRSLSGTNLGTGADGPCVVNGYRNLSTESCAGRSRPDAVAFQVTVHVNANQANIPLFSAPTGLAAGDEVLIIDMWGDAVTVGQYETHRIQSISGNTLTLDANLTHAYNGSGNRVMVQRVPNYTSVSVPAGATLTANGFDGLLGGVLFLRVQSTVSVVGFIDMGMRGYRGGWEPAPQWNGGYRGEGPNSFYGAVQSYTQANGAGGGGDAEYCLAGQGGGGGGYGTSGSYGGAAWLLCRDGSPRWFFGGATAQGGESFGTADLSRLFMGPGGGSGGIDGDNPNRGGRGGRGGGIIVIVADSLTVTGGIGSNGESGWTGYGETGGGGGGAGGSILLQAHSLVLGSGRITAWGGGGGSSEENSDNRGGSGGNGRIAAHYLSLLSGYTYPAAATFETVGYSPASVTSTNLLEGTHSIGTINAFNYSLKSLPAGSVASVQFSQDGENWYDHLHQFNQSSTLAVGMGQHLSLSELGWFGAVFYYRLTLQPTSTGSPVLDDVGVAYCAAGTGEQCAPDSDTDGVADAADNCVVVPNPDQLNTDGDAWGDVCDWDDDNDTVDDPVDNCALNANADQGDTDGDGIGDVCDSDADGDGLPNTTEDQLRTDWLLVDTDGDGIPDATEVGIPSAAYDTDHDGLIDAREVDSDDDGTLDRDELGNGTSPMDTDGDSLPDYRDTDNDGDGVHDRIDNCRLIINASQTDLDEDHQGDVCDADMDGDSVENGREEQLGTNPRNADSDGDSIQDDLELGSSLLPSDADGDGTLNALDTDSDDDGVLDQEENAGAQPRTLLDTDKDGLPDYIDTDSDNDEVLDQRDNCRLIINAPQTDLDQDGQGDACDLVVLAPANGSINNDRPIYNGTAEPGTTVTVIVDGAPVGTTTADTLRSWIFMPSVALASGSHTVKATATDGVGNTILESNTNTFAIDATPPIAPVVLAPSNGSTSNPWPTYSGTAEANSTVKVWIGEVFAGTANADAAGSWIFTPKTALLGGVYKLRATVTDSVGNVSPSSEARSFTVDAVPPNAPTLSVPSLVNTPHPIIAGTAEPDSIVTLLLDGTLVVTAIASSEGLWVIIPIAVLSEAIHKVEVTATDLVGNISPPSEARSFTVDTVPPNAPTVSVPRLVNTQHPIIAGTAEPDSTVTLSLDDAVVGSAVVSPEGLWVWSMATALTEGLHDTKATAKDAAGNVSSPSVAIQFMIDLKPPEAPEIVPPEAFVSTPKPLIGGTAEPGSTVTVWIDGESAGTAEVTPAGSWNFTPSQRLGAGDHQVKATALDAAGNTSLPSVEHSFVIRGSHYGWGCTTAPALPAAWALLTLVLSLSRRRPKTS